METENEAVLCIGANINAAENIIQCIELLRSLVRVDRMSDIYSTPAIGEGSAKYNNVVMKCYSKLHFETLNSEFKKIEINFGRSDDARKNGIVPLDIDIVIWNNEVVRNWDYSQNFFKIGFSKI